MGLGGLWHGASLNFVVWGLWHGMLLFVHRRLEGLPIRVGRPVAIAITFVLVTIGWVFFRMTSGAEIVTVLSAMAGLQGLGDLVVGLLPYLLVAGALMWGVPEEWRWELPTWRPRRIAALGVVTALAIVSLNVTQKFLYFQF
jgi:alginate O-acetyltransferase complex protein AlgI